MLLLRRSRPTTLPRSSTVSKEIGGGASPWPMHVGEGMIRGDHTPAASRRASKRRRIERHLAAVLGADIVGYSALMGRAEEETHRRVNAELDRVFREIEKSHGRVFKIGR